MGAICSSAESQDPQIERNTTRLGIEALKTKYENAGQGHVFQMYADLDEDMQKHLEAQANLFDPL